jgi:predicted Zn-dependent protease
MAIAFPQAQRRGRSGGRLLIAILVAIVSIVTYFGRTDTNPITGESQRVAMSIDQEIALGLQARSEMAGQFGGLDPDPRKQARVREIGNRILSRGLGKATPYQFQYQVLADPETVNAFALPGGQIFITDALYSRLETEGQLAAVLGHETGHVLERHSAQQLAKAQLAQGLQGAAVLATYDPNDPASRNSAAVAALIGQLVTLRYGRNDELEADEWGVKLLPAAGYDPRAIIGVMKILERSSGGRSGPDFLSTHPNPGNRLARIEEAINKNFPEGVPAGLEP